MPEATETTFSQTQHALPLATRQPRPTARQWLTHTGLFLITVFTTTVCGIFMTARDLELNSPQPPAVRGIGSSLFMVPWLYVYSVFDLIRQAFLNPQYLGKGLLYSGSLLAILTAHESGHYLFCRYYGVDATLPFFIPQPPLLLPGTFGAFIRMKSALPSRRALFDIGLAGPLAGFIVMLPIAFVGVLTMQHEAVPAGASVITFNDPLLFRLIARAFRINLADGVINPFYLAAWFGALVTALNLVPVGQLDGGHGTFAVFGGKAHLWIARVMVVAMVALSVVGWLWYGSPAWFVFILLLLIMLRVKHPQPERMEPLGMARVVVGIITLIVFVLCFLPFPITIS
jgi:membrane-associated protease RseP (regulator of RpoE activity)